jgi:hypothetical protein
LTLLTFQGIQEFTTDEVSYEIKSARGKVETHTGRITVKNAQALDTKPGQKTELSPIAGPIEMSGLMSSDVLAALGVSTSAGLATVLGGLFVLRMDQNELISPRNTTRLCGRCYGLRLAH